MVEPGCAVTTAIQQQFEESDEYIMVNEPIKMFKPSGQDTATGRLYIMTTHNIYVFEDERR